jgi:hypothetical protein
MGTDNMSKDLIDAAIEIIKQRESKKGASNFSSKSSIAFLDGTLVEVNYTMEGADEYDHVYFHRNNPLKYTVLEYPPDVIGLVNTIGKKSSHERIADALLNAGGIAGIIAIIFVLGVLIMFFVRGDVNAQVLTIFTLVMGFYFGNATAKVSQSDKAPDTTR